MGQTLIPNEQKEPVLESRHLLNDRQHRHVNEMPQGGEDRSNKGLSGLEQRPFHRLRFLSTDDHALGRLVSLPKDAILITGHQALIF